jgi:hypothetical protein
MLKRILIPGAAVIAAALLAVAQETPRSMASTYDALADSILAVKRTEKQFVLAMLEGHRHGAEARFKGGDFEGAAAEMALFGNEGDNAVAGVRKRLLEGGHHHNAEGEAQGVYEPGFVVVTGAAKKQALAASAALRQAKDDAGRRKAWDEFAAVAASLLNVQ